MRGKSHLAERSLFQKDLMKNICKQEREKFLLIKDTRQHTKTNTKIEEKTHWTDSKNISSYINNVAAYKKEKQKAKLNVEGWMKVEFKKQNSRFLLRFISLFWLQRKLMHFNVDIVRVLLLYNDINWMISAAQRW